MTLRRAWWRQWRKKNQWLSVKVTIKWRFILNKLKGYDISNRIFKLIQSLLLNCEMKVGWTGTLPDLFALMQLFPRALPFDLSCSKFSRKILLMPSVLYSLSFPNTNIYPSFNSNFDRFYKVELTVDLK